MPHVFAHSKVNDFDAWKAVFDANADNRKAAGCKGGSIHRSEEDSNELVIMFEWDSLDKARSFFSSPEMRETMQKAGVTSPTFVYVNEAARFDA